MGNVFGKTTTAKLEEIDNLIDETESHKRIIEQRHKRVVKKLITLSAGCYFAITLILYSHSYIANSNRLLYIKYLLLPPIVFIGLIKSINFYYNRRVQWKNNKSSKLKNKKKQIYRNKEKLCIFLLETI